MTHPPHPPSEMLAAVNAELHKFDMDSTRAERIIRTMFAHMNREVMCAAHNDCDGAGHWAKANAFWITNQRARMDAALAAAQAAALPGDA